MTAAVSIIVMALLYGWQRKLALMPLSLGVLWWVLYSAGFMLESADNTAIDPKSPIHFFDYVVLVGGPFVFFLGVLQAVLPGTASSSVGIITAFFGTVYLVSAAPATYYGFVYFYGLVNSREILDAWQLIMNLGGLLITVSWCFVMMLSVSYKKRPAVKRDTNYQLFDDKSIRVVSRKWPFTPGLARCLGIPFIVLFAVGWCFIVVAFIAVRDKSETFFYRKFDLYGAVIIGPLLFLAELLHAVCSGGASTIMGVFSSILGTLYTVFVGYLLFLYGESYYLDCFVSKYDCSPFHSSPYVNLIFAFFGGVASLFFWTVVLALRPFYSHHSERDQQSSLSIINSESPPS